MALPDVGRWGTAFLNLIAGFFVVLTLQKYLGRNAAATASITGRAAGTAKFAWHRVIRIITPFVVWSGLYVMARGFNYVMFGHETSLRWSWELLFWGTTYHLWFLPYLVVVTLLTLPLIAMAIGSTRSQRIGAAVFLTAALAMMTIPFPSWLPQPGGDYQAMRTLYIRSPGFLLGLGMGLLWISGVRPVVYRWWGLAVVAACLVGCAAMAMLAPSEQVQFIFARAAALAGLLLAFAAWRGPIANFVGRMGSLGFGVYLCHVLVIEALWAVARSMGVPSGLPADVGMFFVAVAASFWLASMMRQSATLKWLVP